MNRVRVREEDAVDSPLEGWIMSPVWILLLAMTDRNLMLPKSCEEC